MGERKVTVSVEELTLSNSLQLTVLVELLEERGILNRQDVLRRMKEISDRPRPS
ncbi:MAG: hypothetical protein L0338_34720 [Acidobacteria bacterium]|nr:hypothetical protein [Acidobacteriota bacterium]